MRRASLAIVFAGIVCLLCRETSVAWGAPTAAEANELLTKKNLVRKGGNFLLPEEVKLQENLTALAALEKKCKDLQTKFDDAAKQGKAAQPLLKKAFEDYEQLQKLMKAPNVSPQQMNLYVANNIKLVALIENLRKNSVVLESDSDNPAFNTLSEELSAARAELAKTLTQILSVMNTIEDKYQPLKDDEEVKAAIAVFGPTVRLGPLKNYQKESSKTATAEKLVFGDTLPVYKSKGQIVFDVQLNDNAVIQVGYDPINESSIIPISVLAAAGVTVPADAPNVTLTTGNGGSFQLRMIKVPKIRIGKYVLENVQVLAAPPAAQALRTVLAQSAFANYEVKFQPEDCKVTLKPLNAVAGGGDEKRPQPVSPPRPVTKPIKP